MSSTSIPSASTAASTPFYEHPYRRALTAAGLRRALGPAYATLDLLLTAADREGRALSYVRDLASTLGVSTRTVLRHLHMLQEAGAIVVDEVPIIVRGERRRGHRNRYRIMPLDYVRSVLAGTTRAVVQTIRDVGEVAGRAAHRMTKEVTRTASQAASSVASAMRQMSPLSDNKVTSSVTSFAATPLSNYIDGDNEYRGASRDARAHTHEASCHRHQREDALSSGGLTPLSVPAPSPRATTLSANEQRVYETLAEALGWPQIPLGTQQAWQPAARSLLAAHSVDDVERCIRWFFSDGWWRENWDKFRLSKIAEKIGGWIAAGKPRAQRSRAERERQTAPGGSSIGLSHEEVERQATAEDGPQFCWRCMGVEKHRGMCTIAAPGSPILYEHTPAAKLAGVAATAAVQS